MRGDLIVALETHLQKNETTYGKQAAFSDFYKRTGSPVKRERPSPNEASAIVVTKSRRRQTRVLEGNDRSEEHTSEPSHI